MSLIFYVSHGAFLHCIAFCLQSTLWKEWQIAAQWTQLTGQAGLEVIRRLEQAGENVTPGNLRAFRGLHTETSRKEVIAAMAVRSPTLRLLREVCNASLLRMWQDWQWRGAASEGLIEDDKSV